MSEQGIVKWYSIARGYGFIRRENTDPESDEGDVFVHYSEIPDDGLAEGDRVSFELVDGPKGLKATNVVRTNGSPA